MTTREIELQAVVQMRASLKKRVIRAAAGPGVESRVDRLELQIEDVNRVIDDVDVELQASLVAVERALDDQRQATERLREDIATAAAEDRKRRVRELASEARWLLAALAFYIAGTAVSIAGTVN